MGENNETNEKNNQKFVYPPDGGYGWVIVFAIVLINSSVLTLIQCFGIIFKDLFEVMENKSLKISTLLHFQSSLYCIVGFFSSPFLKKYGYRTTGFIGATLMCMGIFLTSFVETYESLIFTVSILTGIGQGILMPATYLATYTYFKKRLTMAVSLSTTGASLFSIFMPKICDILLTKVGRRNTILILAVNSLFSLIGCSLLKPLKLEIEESTNSKLTTEMNKFDNNTEKDESDATLLNTDNIYNSTTIKTEKKSYLFINTLSKVFNLGLLKKKSFVFAFVGLGLSFAAELNTVFLIQFVLPNLSKFSQGDVAFVTSLQFSLDLVSRLLLPFLSHSFKIPAKFMYGGALIIATFSRTALTLWFNTYWIVIFCCAFVGVAKGIRAVFQSVIIPKLVNLENIPEANGINMLFNGIVSMIVGSAIGLIRDITTSDIPALHMASAISMVCVVLWLAEWIYDKKNVKITREENRS